MYVGISLCSPGRFCVTSPRIEEWPVLAKSRASAAINACLSVVVFTLKTDPISLSTTSICPY